MDRKQVIEVFKLLKSVYPNFDVSTEKVDIWTRLLKDQNPAIVMKNAERYVLTQKYPPTIADLRENTSEARNNDILDQIKQWEREASGNPRS